MEIRLMRAGNNHNYKVEYKISEEEPEVWESIGYIDEWIFAHATLQKNSRFIY